MKLYGKNKKGKKIIITVPDWDLHVPNMNGQGSDTNSTSGSAS